MNDTHLIDVAKIDDRGRLRTVRPDHAAAMAELISETGQLQPIRVLETIDGYSLVFGARRLAGMALLGRSQILATVVPAADPASDTEIAIQGIVENFGQFGMTALERAIRLAEWKDLYEARNPTAKHGGDRRKTAAYEQDDKMSFCFSEVAAEALDINKRSIERSIAIVRGIATEHQELLRHHRVADRQAELLLLADQTLPRQRAIVDILTREPAEAHGVTEAIAILDRTPVQRPLPIYEKIQQRFTTMKVSDQERFLEMNVDVIERWMAKRLAAQSQRNAA